jgi:hypothetical protein
LKGTVVAALQPAQIASCISRDDADAERFVLRCTRHGRQRWGSFSKPFSA